MYHAYPYFYIYILQAIPLVSVLYDIVDNEYGVTAHFYWADCGIYDELRSLDSHTERFYSLKFFLYPECRLALPNVFRISKILSTFKPDIIHIMTEFNMGMTGLNYGKKYNIPTISNYTTNISQYTKYYNLEFLKQPILDYMTWFHKH